MNKYEKKTDEQLVAEIREGNKEFMDFLMVKYKSMVRKKPVPCFCLAVRMKI